MDLVASQDVSHVFPRGMWLFTSIASLTRSFKVSPDVTEIFIRHQVVLCLARSKCPKGAYSRA